MLNYKKPQTLQSKLTEFKDYVVCGNSLLPKKFAILFIKSKLHQEAIKKTQMP